MCCVAVAVTVTGACDWGWVACCVGGDAPSLASNAAGVGLPGDADHESEPERQKAAALQLLRFVTNAKTQ